MERTKEIYLIRLVGELTVVEVGNLATTLEEALGMCETLALDLSGVTQLDSAGIQLLMYMKELARRSQKRVRLTKHSSAVLEVLDLYGLAAYFSDRIVLSPGDRERFAFSYGARKSGKEGESNELQ